MADTYLESLEEDNRKVVHQIREVFEPMSLEQLSFKPSAKSWSILECINHLNKTAKAYLTPLDEAIKKSTVMTAPHNSSSYSPSLMGKMMLNFFNPEPKFKAKTLPKAKPSKSKLGKGEIEEFYALYDILQKMLETSRFIDLKEVKLPSPFARVVRFTVGDVLTILVRHNQRHLGQMVRVTKTPGFPA